MEVLLLSELRTPQMKTYADRLIATKSCYPFSTWASYGHILVQNTQENCSRASAIFDQLIATLILRGEAASEESKRAAFSEAVEGLNALHRDTFNLIETEERHDLCNLLGAIAIAAGVDPAYGKSGEGPASGRDW